MDLEQGARLKLDRTLIPESLHKIIPLAEKWGFECQDDQDEFIVQMKTAKPDEVAEFNQQIGEARDSIIEWGAMLPELDQHKSQMDEKVWDHPYWVFLSLLSIYDETYEVADRQVEWTALVRSNGFREASEQADHFFRNKAYQQFVETLAPYADLLSEMQKKKLSFARQKLDKQ
ncbi:hypothetical protein Enr10x_60650 [Gimesia panareensis]|uniref:Uncharacterized protein n=2 Tax=Gimesia panareensis TaxID=2527978 RepID=A0A517QGM2_9PLAN|nr:hypothetical protein Enr10x_60650 [Gimesia panareensis]